MSIVGGLALVVLSWLASPILGGVATVVFTLVFAPRILRPKTVAKAQEFAMAARDLGLFDSHSGGELRRLQAGWLSDGHPRGISAEDYLRPHAGRPD